VLGKILGRGHQYLNIGSLPKKVTNVMNVMAKTTDAILAMMPILKYRAKRARPSLLSHTAQFPSQW